MNTVVPMHEPTVQELPANVQLELAFLGALLVNNRVYGEVAHFLEAWHFSDEFNGAIFSEIANVIEGGGVIDARTFAANHLPEGADDKAAYIIHLENCIVTVTDAPHYARTIKTLADARELNGFFNTAAEEALNPANHEGLIEECQRVIDGVRDDGTKRQPIISVGDAAGAAVDEAIKVRDLREAGEAVPFISSGLDLLDQEIGGFRGGQLIIVAGASSMGKSALALTIGQNVAAEYAGTARARHVLFQSLEMSKDDLAHRALARLSEIAVSRIAYGKFGTGDIDALRGAEERLQAMPLYLNANGSVSVQTLRMDALQTRRKHGLDMIVVDYLQLMTGTGDNRTQEVGSISRGLKTLAMDLDVPVIAVSQLSRAVNSREGNRPQLSDLRESGSIEQDADIVLFAHNQAYYDKNRPPLSGTPEFFAWEADLRETEKHIEIIIGKQRQGPAGHSVTVGFNKYTISMENEDGQGELV